MIKIETFDWHGEQMDIHRMNDDTPLEGWTSETQPWVTPGIFIRRECICVAPWRGRIEISAELSHTYTVR